MAIMGRKKQMVKQMIENRRADVRELENEQRERWKENKTVSQEEHNEKLQLLKNIGLLKEEDKK